MTTSVSRIPNQTISLSAKNVKWQEETADAIIALSNINSSNRKYKLKTYYDAYNGVLNMENYEYVTKVHGENFKNFPAQITNWNILKPVIDRIIGEKIQRPFIYQVSALNSDIQSIKEKEITEIVSKNMQKLFINELNNLNVDTQQPQQEAEMPQQIKDMITVGYKDTRSILGQQSMDYIVAYNEFIDKSKKSFFDFLVAGETYTYRYLEHDEPLYETINPLEIDYQRDPNKDFIEDSDWAIHYSLMTPSSVNSKFYDDEGYTKEIIEELENPMSSGYNYPFSIYSNTGTTDDNNIERLIPVVHIVWQSKQKLGYLSYTDEFGSQQETIVTEEYKPAPDESVKWIWVNQPWEVYKVYDRYYLRGRPIPESSLSKNNIALRKIPYNGRVYSNRNTENISLISIGMPYQITYNVYKYRYELMVAKAKGMIAQLDINSLPAGWDVDKWIHYLESMNLVLVDYNKEGSRINPSHNSNIDMSLGNFIDKYETLLASIKSEWESLSGVSRQRQGQIGPNELVGTVEAAIYQASAITEGLFYDHSSMERRDLQYLIDLSQIAWVNNKKSSFITHDGREAFLDIDGKTYANSEYGIFVTNTSKEYRKLEQARQNAQAFAQNGLGASAVLEILDSDNFSEIKKKVKEAEEMERILNENLENIKAQNAQAIEDKITERELESKIFEADENERDRENKVEIATINALGFAKDTDADNDGIPDLIEQRKIALSERKQSFDESISAAKLKLEELKIKQQNNNKK